MNIKTSVVTRPQYLEQESPVEFNGDGRVLFGSKSTVLYSQIVSILPGEVLLVSSYNLGSKKYGLFDFCDDNSLDLFPQSWVKKLKDLADKAFALYRKIPHAIYTIIIKIAGKLPFIGKLIVKFWEKIKGLFDKREEIFKNIVYGFIDTLYKFSRKINDLFNKFVTPLLCKVLKWFENLKIFALIKKLLKLEDQPLYTVRADKVVVGKACDDELVASNCAVGDLTKNVVAGPIMYRDRLLNFQHDHKRNLSYITAPGKYVFLLNDKGALGNVYVEALIFKPSYPPSHILWE